MPPADLCRVARGDSPARAFLMHVSQRLHSSSDFWGAWMRARGVRSWTATVHTHAVVCERRAIIMRRNTLTESHVHTCLLFAEDHCDVSSVRVPACNTTLYVKISK